jgi:peptidyl-prolyl cis-trans isomerase D
MITFIRSLINSKFGAIFALFFVGVIAVGFALGDVTGTGTFGGLTGGNVAKVGKQNIGLGEFEKLLKNGLKSQKQKNPTLDMPTFIEGGGFEGTLNAVLNRYSIAIFGENSEMAVSKRLVDYEIRNIPGAQSADGKFSQIAFDRFLQQIGLDEKTVRTDITQNLYSEQLLKVAGRGPAAPDKIALTYASLLLEKRTGEVAVILSQAFAPSAPPADAQLAKYYKDNSEKFTIPEKRAVSYAFFDKSIIGEKAKPTAEEIAAYYKSNEALYKASETRSLSRVIVPTEAGAKSVVDRINAGQSIAAVAQSLGLAVTTEQNLTREKLATSASKTVADATFKAASGTVIPPSKGALGWYVVKVDGVQQVAAKTLAQVSSEIEKTLAVKKEQDVIYNTTSEIEEELSGGAKIADIAKEQGLKVETTPKLLANGQNTLDPSYRPIPEMQVILPAAFQLEADGEAQLIEIVKGERFAIISVAELEEAAPPPLAKVSDVVLQQWAISQGAVKAKAAAEQVRKAVAAGKPFKEALAALNVKLPPSQTLSGTRAELRQQGQQLPPPLALMFSMKQGSVKELPAPNDAGFFIVNLTQVIKGDASSQKEMLALTKKEVTQLAQQEHAEQFIAATGKSVGVKKYDDALATLRKSLTTRNDGN